MFLPCFILPLLSPLFPAILLSLPRVFFSLPSSLSCPPSLPRWCTGVLKSVLEAAVEGASVLNLCEMGDSLILEETGKVYKKEKDMKKGKVSYEVCRQILSQ